MSTSFISVTSVTSVDWDSESVTGSSSDVTDVTDVTYWGPREADARVRGFLHPEKTHGGKLQKPVIPVTTGHTDGPLETHVAPLRHRWVLPRLGDLVWVVSERDAMPWRSEPARVWARRGGVPRIGRSGRPLRPEVVKFLVLGYECWYPWYRLEPCAEVYP